MVDAAEFTKAVIAKLDPAQGINGVVAGQFGVAEMEVDSPNFTYPCVRVKVVYSQPRENGTCREDKDVVSFTVSSFSDNQGSVQCQKLAQAAIEALYGKRLYVPGQFNTLKINKRGSTGAYKTKPGVWRVDAHFWTHTYAVQ